jgi:CHAT domain-containing protein
VSGDQLGMILRDFSSLRLAVLNACDGARASHTDSFSGVTGSLVKRDIPAVIAMQSEISDEAAIAFATSFYDAIAAGSAVDASLAAARLSMFAERSDDIEWGTPVLFMRAPDGRIFDLPPLAPHSYPPIQERLTPAYPAAPPRDPPTRYRARSRTSARARSVTLTSSSPVETT